MTELLSPLTNIYIKNVSKILANDYFQAKERTILHINTDSLPINLPAFQSAAQIITIRPEIILYPNFKNRNKISYIYFSEFSILIWRN